jgi:hypothetical protein
LKRQSSSESREITRDEQEESTFLALSTSGKPANHALAGSFPSDTHELSSHSLPVGSAGTVETATAAASKIALHIVY